MTDINPSKRISIDQIKKHPWLLEDNNLSQDDYENALKKLLNNSPNSPKNSYNSSGNKNSSLSSNES